MRTRGRHAISKDGDRTDALTVNNWLIQVIGEVGPSSNQLVKAPEQGNKVSHSPNSPLQSMRSYSTLHRVGGAGHFCRGQSSDGPTLSTFVLTFVTT